MNGDQAADVRRLVLRAAAEQASIFDALMEARQESMRDKSYAAMLEAFDICLACLTQLIEAGAIGVVSAGGKDIAWEIALENVYESFLYLK